MRYLKMLGTSVAVAALFAALAGTASATVLTSPSGTAYTGTIEATAGTLYLTGAWSNVECKHSRIKGKLTTHGASVTAEGPVETWHISECNWPTTVVTGGRLVLHTSGSTANGNATVTWVGMEALMHTSFGTCRFRTGAETDTGTLKGGAPAVISLESSVIPVTEGNFFCGNSGIWQGSFTVTSPSSLFID